MVSMFTVAFVRVLARIRTRAVAPARGARTNWKVEEPPGGMEADWRARLKGLRPCVEETPQGFSLPESCEHPDAHTASSFQTKLLEACFSPSLGGISPVVVCKPTPTNRCPDQRAARFCHTGKRTNGKQRYFSRS